MMTNCQRQKPVKVPLIICLPWIPTNQTKPNSTDPRIGPCTQMMDVLLFSYSPTICLLLLFSSQFLCHLQWSVVMGPLNQQILLVIVDLTCKTGAKTWNKCSILRLQPHMHTDRTSVPVLWVCASVCVRRHALRCIIGYRMFFLLKLILFSSKQCRRFSRRARTHTHSDNVETLRDVGRRRRRRWCHIQFNCKVIWNFKFRVL